MDFSEYQKKAMTTCLDPGDDFLDFMHRTLGFAGEAGEIIDKVKKIVRDKKGVPTAEDVEELKKEIGDVLWYCAVFADYLKLDLQEVAELNIEKLASRKERGKLRGAGDNR